MFGLVLGALSAVGSFLASVVTVAKPIVAAATALVAKLPEVLVTAKMVVDTIASVVSTVAEFLGIAPKGENPEELGAKAMQEGTRKQLEGESSQEYLDYLRRDVTLDEAKFKAMSTEEKIACSSLGTAMVSKSIEEKVGIDLSPDFLLTIPKAKLSASQVAKLINAFASNGFSSMDDFTGYIKNDLSEDRVPKIGNIVRNSLKELNPSLSDAEIQHEIIDMKSSYNNEKNY